QVVNIITISSTREKLDRKSYAIGFIQGLDKKLKEQSIKMKNENKQEYVLVAVMPVPIIKKYNEIEKGFSGDFKGKGIKSRLIIILIKRVDKMGQKINDPIILRSKTYRRL
ncbi:hypothetical protein, partial [Vallitalea sediminicola]